MDHPIASRTSVVKDLDTSHYFFNTKRLKKQMPMGNLINVQSAVQHIISNIVDPTHILLCRSSSEFLRL